MQSSFLFFNAGQLLNALFSIFLTDEGMLISFNDEQLSKTEDSIESTEPGITTFIRDVQSLNAAY